jgi:hypothetical protein
MVERQEDLHKARDQHAHQSGKQVRAEVGKVVLGGNQLRLSKDGFGHSTHLGLEREQRQADEHSRRDDQRLEDDSGRVVTRHGADHQTFEDGERPEEDHIGGVFVPFEVNAEERGKGSADAEPKKPWVLPCERLCGRVVQCRGYQRCRE